MLREEQKEQYLARIANLQALANDDVEQAYMGTVTMFNLLYGKGSAHFKHLRKENIRITTLDMNGFGSRTVMLAPIVISALSNMEQEIQQGLLINIEQQITGEVVGDFVQLARSALDEGRKDVAAVLASAALEDLLKRKANDLGVTITDTMTLSDTIAELNKVGFFKGAENSLVSSHARLRNYAMHANWDKITVDSVSSLVTFVENFLLRHFS